jgi:hypothetical protein
MAGSPIMNAYASRLTTEPGHNTSLEKKLNIPGMQRLLNYMGLVVSLLAL